jgi:hypothetical protein
MVHRRADLACDRGALVTSEATATPPRGTAIIRVMVSSREKPENPIPLYITSLFSN